MTRERPDIPLRPRQVTQDEIDFYRVNGWVHLKQLITEPDAGAIRARIERVADEYPNDFAHASDFASSWENVPDPSRHDASLLAFTHSSELGEVAADLQGSAVKYWRDEVLRKMPAGRPGSAETPWHQDQPYTPYDRSGRPQIWIALVDIPPERGAMRFLSGSHRSGMLGRAFNDRSEAMTNRLRALQEEFPLSEPLHLRAGDATVHDGMTVHRAPPNATDVARWAYVVQFFVADALYNGASHPLTDRWPQLEVDQPFPEDQFPTTGRPRRLESLDGQSEAALRLHH